MKCDSNLSSTYNVRLFTSCQNEHMPITASIAELHHKDLTQIKEAKFLNVTHWYCKWFCTNHC